jgi:uncharacterized protein (DUF433 family)
LAVGLCVRLVAPLLAPCYNRLQATTVEGIAMNEHELLQRITVNPNMAFGKPTIRGLRYSVEWLLELLSSGMSHEEILADYEDLAVEDIYAVLAYATKLAQVKRTVALAA